MPADAGRLSAPLCSRTSRVLLPRTDSGASKRTARPAALPSLGAFSGDGRREKYDAIDEPDALEPAIAVLRAHGCLPEDGPVAAAFDGGFCSLGDSWTIWPPRYAVRTTTLRPNAANMATTTRSHTGGRPTTSRRNIRHHAYALTTPIKSPATSA